MVHVVEAACTFEGGMSRGVVVLESDVEGPGFQAAFDELPSIDSRQLALQYAASKGMGAARLNGNLVGPYPINSQGYPLDQVPAGPGNKPLPPEHPLRQPARYRVEVPVVAPIR